MNPPYAGGREKKSKLNASLINSPARLDRGGGKRCKHVAAFSSIFRRHVVIRRCGRRRRIIERSEPNRLGLRRSLLFPPYLNPRSKEKYNNIMHVGYNRI